MKSTIKILLGFLAFSYSLIASAQDSAVETGGFGKWIIDSLFEAGSISSQPADAGIIGSVIMPLSLVVMLVATVVIVFKAIQHLLVVAQAKDMDQSPVSMTWAPLHMVIAVVLIMPLPSGYSMGQYGAIWMGHQSNTLGNLTASRATNYFRTTGAITPPALPSVQTAVNGIIASKMCAYMHNTAATFVEDNGGTPIKIKSRSMNDEELRSIGGVSLKTEDGDGLTRSGVTFERDREGGFLGGNKVLDDYCGAVAIQYTAKTEGLFWTDDKAVPVHRQDASDIADSDAEKCQFGPLCLTDMGTTFNDHRENVISLFTSAHKNAANAFNREASSGSSSSSIVKESLLYDLDKYFEGKSDKDAAEAYANLQANESEKINKAVKDTAALIDKMQTNIYKSYASAVDTYGTQRNGDTSNNFLDTMDRVGWPVLGLYWFQFTNFSQQVMKSVSVQALYTGDFDEFVDAFADSLDDPQLGIRLKNRIKTYRGALASELQNTRLDNSPASISGSSEDREDKAMSAGRSALDLREAFPAMKDELIANAGAGGMNPRNIYESTQQSINSITRGIIFPSIVSALREDNLVNALVNTGHNIIGISEVIYSWNVLSRVVSKRSEPRKSDQQIEEEKSTWESVKGFFKSPISSAVGWVAGALGFVWDIIATVFQDFASFWFYVFLMGLFLAFYVPAMIMVQWLIGFVTWIIYIAEATVIIPLWGLLFTADMGQKAFAPQTAQQGFVHLLSILVYPSLMIIGFIIGLKVIDLSSMFLVDFLLIGLMNSTDGYIFGLLSLVAGLLILGLACYQIIIRVFSLVLELNDRAMSWVGNRQGYGEGGVEGQVRGGVNAAIGKVEIGKRSGGAKAAQDMGGKKQ